MSIKQTFAAVDLGSNSFHLVIAQLIDGELKMVDKIKERVQLAAGLDDRNYLNEEAQTRALACLRRFGERLETFAPPQKVRIIGTNTLRKATNARRFCRLAEKALGHPVDVVSGTEEARLVYRGVCGSVEVEDEQRLVVDIGGGSTECIIGKGPQILSADSLAMGCVVYTKRFFDHGQITERGFEAAVTAARLELGAMHRSYRSRGWDRCYGSSGTINAVEVVLANSGWSDHGVSLDGLEHLQEALLKAGDASRIQLPGLKPDRAAVFAGGVAVLLGVMRSLKIERMHASKTALREGALFDLIGRGRSEDHREHTIERFARRYDVDEVHAERVKKTALGLLAQIGDSWRLPERAALYLGWAARLHEVGMALAYSGHHKHGAYLLANSDMPGFARDGQAVMAALVLGQRRKLTQDRIAELVGGRAVEVMRLAIILRLAVRLHRTRNDAEPPPVILTVDADTLHLRFPEDFLDDRPLTRADFEKEAYDLRPSAFALYFE